MPDLAGLRVLCVTNMWPRDDFPGYGSFVHSQMDSMAQQGVHLSVHMIDGRRTQLAYLRSAVRFLRMNLEPRRFDLIHAHTGHCGVIARLQLQTPVLVSYVGYDVYATPIDGEGRRSRKSRVEAALFRQLGSVVARTITKSGEMERMLPARVRARNVVVPNGVDRTRFAPLGRATARAKLGWSPDDPVVLFAGNPDNPRKRHDIAEAAVEIVRRWLPNARLEVCWGVTPADVPVLMSAADVLVHPSLAEGSPNVVKEALACDLPVVAADVGDVSEYLPEIRNCYVAERSPEAFAHAVLEVLRTEERCDGRARTAHLDIEAIAERLARLYLDCVEAKRKSAD